MFGKKLLRIGIPLNIAITILVAYFWPKNPEVNNSAILNEIINAINNQGDIYFMAGDLHESTVNNGVNPSHPQSIVRYGQTNQGILQLLNYVDSNRNQEEIGITIYQDFTDLGSINSQMECVFPHIAIQNITFMMEIESLQMGHMDAQKSLTFEILLEDVAYQVHDNGNIFRIPGYGEISDEIRKQINNYFIMLYQSQEYLRISIEINSRYNELFEERLNVVLEQIEQVKLK